MCWCGVWPKRILHTAGVSWSWVPLLYSNCMEMDGRSQAGGAHFIIGKYFSPALEIFFLELCGGTFISRSQHSFILLKVWRLCQLEQLTWRPPQLHLCWNLILSSAPWELQYNHGDSHGSSRQNRSLDLTDIESGSKCLADFLSFYISFLLGFVKLRSSWIWKIGKWDTNIHSHFLESVSGGPMSVPGFN